MEQYPPDPAKRSRLWQAIELAGVIMATAVVIGCVVIVYDIITQDKEPIWLFPLLAVFWVSSIPLMFWGHRHL